MVCQKVLDVECRVPSLDSRIAKVAASFRNMGYGHSLHQTG
jgi:hypothetical protein